MDEQTPFWSEVKKNLVFFWRWFSQHLLAPVVAILIIIGSILLVSMGFKELQIGGLLGRLFRKTPSSDPEKKIDVVNSIDPNRIDRNGNLIPINQSDSKGDTQVQVVPIKDPGLFSDPKTVTFTPPNATEPVQIVLPDGITNKDVDKVLIVNPSVVLVSVKDNSGIDAKKVDDLLSKYGSK